MSSQARSTAPLLFSPTYTKGLPALINCGSQESRSLEASPNARAQSSRSKVCAGSIAGVVSQIKGRVPLSTRTGMGPAFSSSTKDSLPSGTMPSFTKRKLAPTVGWPAKATSCLGVKMRNRATQSGRVAGRTNTVSDRFSSRAMFCIMPSSSAFASINTASGFPSRGRWLKTSTTWYRYVCCADGMFSRIMGRRRSGPLQNE